MSVGIVYGLVCPVTNSIRYIGQTIVSAGYRLYRHKHDINGKNHKQNWINQLIKMNVVEQIKVIELWKGDESDLDDAETRLIEEYRNNGFDLVNTAPGGKCGSQGYHHTDEAKKRIAKASQNRVVSDETRQRLSCSVSRSLTGNKRRLGKKHSKETKQKISEKKRGSIPWNKGRRLSEDTKQKLSENKRGKKKPLRTKEHCLKISLAKKEFWRKRREQGLTGRLGDDKR